MARVAIIDVDMVNGLHDGGNGYRSDLGTWVAGESRTMLFARERPVDDIVAWVQAVRRELGGPVDLDLMCHGAKGFMTNGEMVFRLMLGNGGHGIYVANVQQLAGMSGCVRKMRVFCCGVRSDAYPSGEGFPAGSDGVEHTLMSRIADAVRVPVKYSLNTFTGDVEVRGGANVFTPDHMRSPVFVVRPGAAATCSRLGAASA